MNELGFFDGVRVQLIDAANDRPTRVPDAGDEQHPREGAARRLPIKTLTDLSKVSSSSVPGLVVDLRHVFVRGR